MSFFDAIVSVFTKYATFEGRARRSEFWYFTLFNFLVGSLLAYLGRSYSFFSILASLYSLGVFIPALAVAWRRLHDMGKSGGYWFFIFIPIVGPIMLVIWLATDSQPDRNAYGESPKGPLL